MIGTGTVFVRSRAGCSISFAGLPSSDTGKNSANTDRSRGWTARTREKPSELRRKLLAGRGKESGGSATQRYEANSDAPTVLRRQWSCMGIAWYVSLHAVSMSVLVVQTLTAGFSRLGCRAMVYGVWSAGVARWQCRTRACGRAVSALCPAIQLAYIWHPLERYCLYFRHTPRHTFSRRISQSEIPAEGQKVMYIHIINTLPRLSTAAEGRHAQHNI